MCLILLTVLSKYSMASFNNLTFLANHVKGNAQLIFLCNPQKSSVNVSLIKKIKKHCHKKT